MGALRLLANASGRGGRRISVIAIVLAQGRIRKVGNQVVNFKLVPLTTGPYQKGSLVGRPVE